MRILGDQKNIVLKPAELDKITNKQEREKYVKENAFINIPATPAINIMIDIYYNPEVQLRSHIDVDFYGAGGSSHIPYYTANQKHLITTDDKFKILRLLDATYGGARAIDTIAFDCKGLKEDFSFWVRVYFKYEYQIRAGKYNRNFWFDDGQCTHEEGDNFFYDSREITVMDIDHEKGIVSCGATGDLSNT